MTADQPWFNLTVGVSPSEGAASSLSVSVAFYGRLIDGSDLQQAISGTPSGTPLMRETGLPVNEGAAGLAASTCVTVVPSDSASVPATGEGICPARLEDVRPGLPTAQGRLPGRLSRVRLAPAAGLVDPGLPLHHVPHLPAAQRRVVRPAAPLRVGVVVPVTASGLTTLADALTDNHDVPTTLAVSPLAVSAVDATRTRDGMRALGQLAALSGDEMIDQPYVPINLAALTGPGCPAKSARSSAAATTSSASAGLKPDGGPWVDTSSSLSQGDAANLASGLQLAGATQAVVSDNDLASAGVSNYTFAQPFTLDLGHGSTITAVAANSNLSTRFTASPGQPGARGRAAAGRAVVRPLREHLPRGATRGRGGPAGWVAALRRLHGRAARRAHPRQRRAQGGDPQPALRRGARGRQPGADGAPASSPARPAAASRATRPTASRSTASSWPPSARPWPGTRPT